MTKQNKLIEKLQELESLRINNIISREWYYRELEEMLKYADNSDEIKLINSYRDLDV